MGSKAAEGSPSENGNCYAVSVPLLARQPFSFDDYVELEASSPVKHEFLDGEVWAMAGGSVEHSAIAANLARVLGQALLGQRCRVFSSDLRIRVEATGLATYPDLSVICERVALDPADRKGHTATNPTLLVEAYDRGEKLVHYKQIASLREVVLVAHDEPRIDLWRRTERSWTQLSFRPGEVAELASLHGVALPVDDVYFDPLAP